MSGPFGVFYLRAERAAFETGSDPDEAALIAWGYWICCHDEGAQMRDPHEFAHYVRENPDLLLAFGAVHKDLVLASRGAIAGRELPRR